MHYVHLECLDPAEGPLRFYRYEIALGLFDAHHLNAVYGRIGEAGALKQLAAGAIDDLWRKLAQAVTARVRQGYAMVEISCPDEVHPTLQDASAAGAFDTGLTERQARALSLSREMLADVGGCSADVLRIDAALARPGPGRPRRRQKPDRPPTRPAGPALRQNGQLLRDVVARLAMDLLSEDSLALQSVMRGLTLPFADEVNGTNVTFLRSAEDRVLSMAINQFVFEACCRGDGNLSGDLDDRLTSLGINTVRELVGWRWEDLLTAAWLSPSEQAGLLRACGRYRLVFSMARIHYRTGATG